MSFNVLDDANPTLTYTNFASRVDALLSAPLPSCLESSTTPLVQERDVNTMHTDTSKLSESSAARRYRRLLHHCEPRSAPKDKGRPIYEVLLEKGAKAKAKQEALVQARLAKEVSDLRAAPTLQPGTRLCVPREGERIEDKLLQRAKEHSSKWQKTVEERTKRKEEEISASLVFKPSITRKGKGTTSKFRKAAAEYPEQCRQQRLEEAAKAEQQRDEVLGEVCPKPTLAPHSERLAAAHREKQGVDGMCAGDALFLLAQRKQARDAAAGVNDSTFSPTVTPHTSHKGRTGDAGQRLYDLSTTQDERRSYRLERWREAHTPFTPQLTRLAYAVAPRYDERRAASGETGDDSGAHERFCFHPTIDPVSAAIARQLPESVSDRLCKAAEPRADTEAASDSQSFYSIPEAYRAPAMPPSIASAIAEYETRRKERLAELCAEQEEQRMRECTFAPRVNSPSRASGGPSNVAARNDAWSRRREQKMEALRAARGTDAGEKHRDALSPESLAPPALSTQVPAAATARRVPLRPSHRSSKKVATYNAIYNAVYGL
ncbi:hypothetical protein STCU_05074 [Strigomonas culicis]|uniref:Uncharacterized protein n=1 Tax=Strigomonas culicis TaxID=28005 RepID=S9VMU5_9TRYP|nr:hypothetical protein STCU_05074 [Strigomonas culicis]|eukprot:EPY28506.1 hypothetical protein STCU_05074 [Strigomonas culicis]